MQPCGNFRERYDQELTIFSTDFGRLWAGIGLIILFALVPLLASPYMMYVFNMIGISAIAAIGLHLDGKHWMSRSSRTTKAALARSELRGRHG